ncbi:MAG: DUF2905 domain-containing protein [Anaerolineales bacterium]
MSILARWLVITGLGLVALGGLLWLVSRIPGLENLPGTIRIEGKGFTCIFPLLASIVLSLLLTIALNIIGRLLNK